MFYKQNGMKLETTEKTNEMGMSDLPEKSSK